MVDENLFMTYFTDYAKGFDTFDAEGLAKYFYSPAHMVQNGTVTTFGTPDEVLKQIKGLLANYQKLGYKKGNLVEIEVKPMGAWSAAVSVHWIIDHVDGSILRDFHCTYNLLLQEGDWKILVATNHDV